MNYQSSPTCLCAIKHTNAKCQVDHFYHVRIWLETNLRCWPCTSTWPHMRPPRGTGLCSGVADGCNQTPGCAKRPQKLWRSPESSRSPLIPLDRGHARHSPHPKSWKLMTAGQAALVWHRKAGTLALEPPGRKIADRIRIKWNVKMW